MTRITDYTALTAPAAGDQLVVVDVSDLSMSPAGTTKNITISALLPGFALLSATGDTSGTKDTAALNAALAAGLNPWLCPGVYYWICGLIVVTNPATEIRGSGRQNTKVFAVGTGDCLRMYGTGSSSAVAGALHGFTIDGTHAGAGSAGFHLGDMFQLDLDICAQNFTGSGSIGVWLDNQYTFTEQITGKIYVTSNSNGVVFDNSTGTSLGANATGSFDRFCADIFLVSGGAGNGVTLQNGAFIVDGDFAILGNMTTAATKYACLTLKGQNAGATNYSEIIKSFMRIGVELRNAGGGTVAPYSIFFGTVFFNNIAGCAGLIDFGANAQFALTNQFTGIGTGCFHFDGPVYGDSNLGRATSLGRSPFNQGSLTSSGTITAQYTGLARVNPGGSNVTGIILAGGDPDDWRDITVLNIGTGSITFAAAGTSNVADGAADVIAGGTAATFHWSVDDALWYRAY